MLDLINDKRLDARKAKYDKKLVEIRKEAYVAKSNKEALLDAQQKLIRKTLAAVLAERLAR